MLDLIAAIVSVDPPSLLAWLVLTFAAGMYPVGIMLGSSCSPCCSGCILCESGSLPETLTVTFDGLTTRGDQTYPNLINVFARNCRGQLASGVGQAPFSESNIHGQATSGGGPITGVTITSATPNPLGAILGRRSPTLTATARNTGGAAVAGAQWSLTLEQFHDPTIDNQNDLAGRQPCGINVPAWRVASASVTDAGQMATSDGYLEILAQAGDTTITSAVVTYAANRSEPQLTIQAATGTGTGATFTPSYYESEPGVWQITSVQVGGSPSGYQDGQALQVVLGQRDVQVSAASLVTSTQRVAPTISASAGGAGTGAVLSVSLGSDFSWWDGRPYWYISGISVTDGGSGYAEFDQVTATVTDGQGYGLYAEVSAVDEDGAITAIAVYWGGEYYDTNDVLESVSVLGGGGYYRHTGYPDQISIQEPGMYYRQDPSLPPIVFPVTVTIEQSIFANNGSGAQIQANIDLSTSSPTFGSFLGFTVTSGGSGYIGSIRGQSKFCRSLHREPIVLLRDDLRYGTRGRSCSYSFFLCQGSRWSDAFGFTPFEWTYPQTYDVVRVQYRGATVPPLVSISTDGEWHLSPTGPKQATGNVLLTGSSGNWQSCSDLSFLASSGSAFATVTAGGVFSEQDLESCYGCCSGPIEGPTTPVVRGPCTAAACQALGYQWLPNCVSLDQCCPPAPPPPTSTTVYQTVCTGGGTVGGFGFPGDQPQVCEEVAVTVWGGPPNAKRCDGQFRQIFIEFSGDCLPPVPGNQYWGATLTLNETEPGRTFYGEFGWFGGSKIYGIIKCKSDGFLLSVGVSGNWQCGDATISGEFFARQLGRSFLNILFGLTASGAVAGCCPRIFDFSGKYAEGSVRGVNWKMSV